MADRNSDPLFTSNPEALQAQNPLIASIPADTFDRISSVLDLLQEYFGAKRLEEISTSGQFGGYLLFDIVSDALNKQVEALKNTATEGDGNA